jgi:hypothetical protein
VDVVSSVVAGNGTGISSLALGAGDMTVQVNDSSVVQNTSGISAASTAVANRALAVVTNSTVANNGGSGISASGAGAYVLASGNTVISNNIGFTQLSSATFETAQNNVLRLNATASSGTITGVNPLQ